MSSMEMGLIIALTIGVGFATGILQITALLNPPDGISIWYKMTPLGKVLFVIGLCTISLPTTLPAGIIGGISYGVYCLWRCCRRWFIDEEKIKAYQQQVEDDEMKPWNDIIDSQNKTKEQSRNKMPDSGNTI